MQFQPATSHGDAIPWQAKTHYIWGMDITTIPGSRIVDIARLAFTTPGVDFLCFGESDQPSPASARVALVDAVEAGVTKYPPIRGLPPLREALSAYLSTLHGTPIAAGTGLPRTTDTPILRLTRRGGAIAREDIWPGADGLNRPVLLPGGEVGLLIAWWHAPDGSEWRWQVEFYNHR